MNFERKFETICLLFLLIFYGILISAKINLVTADLGRHIKNGEIIVSQTTSGRLGEGVFQTNLYSYTFPDFPFLNHHWGSGIIFYLVHKVTGFEGLSVFFTVLSLVTFYLFFDTARKSNFHLAFLSSIFLIPVLSSRDEIRPELFSYLFCGIFFWVLWEVKKKRLANRFLFLLPVLTAAWANLHIYFFLGLFLIGVFLLDEVVVLLKKGGFLGNLGYLSFLGGNLVLSLLGALLNPAGIKGLFYPLEIFKGYGYRLLENQSVWFLDKIIEYPPSLYFKIAFSLLLLSWVFVIFRRKNFSVINLILSLFISYLGWTAVRNFAIFGYFALPIIVGNIGEIGDVRPAIWRIGGEEKETLRIFLTASTGVLVLFGLLMLKPTFWLGRISSLGFGLKKGNAASAEFFLKENLRGPIFNNYDNGGYLIYYLYPKEKVFVDNRPEAYPEKFFKEVYIPMQEQEDIWKEVDKKYSFNVIFFHRNDLTPWSQTFLVSRVLDPNWAPVFVDDYSIIFLKRIKDNEVLIKKFELPKEMFSVKK